jgi:hypothetical protein
VLSSYSMRHRFVLTLAAFLLCPGVHAWQAQQQQPPAVRPSPLVAMQPTPAAEGLLEIYRIDLEPSGTGFSVGKPVLEGDEYVLKALPERQVVRVAKSKIKKITLYTKNLDEQAVWEIDLVPSGRMIARAEPALKGTTYVFQTWQGGTTMSLRQADVRQIKKVTGIAAFKIQQEERGAKLTADLPMQGGTVTILPGAPAGQGTAPASGPAAPGPSANWIYDGVPGITDAYAPPSAVVSSPGDVPKAAPQPNPPNR